ncbi:Hypothetical predicted protein [Paramuricea clavata]|uniref:Uncharacterized protein n=1 Tax=Paramuricea clavata TaxID=317549 RepID=A0A6S7GWL9_PARCT|nr:Hypothetical predicted protein [Paramuricea clavata]
MSTRDPIWLTPLVKSLLQRNYKLVARGKNDQAEEISKRIAEIIAQNRRNMDADTFERGLNNNQFAYRKGGSCVDALLKVQHFNLKALDNSPNKTVRLFAMDFSKAFDSVRHNILGEKLKATGLNPYLVNWYLDFLKDRKQRIVHNGIICEWKMVNKGTTQGSVSGPHLFNLFVNDLTIEEENKTALDKYADDVMLQVVVLKNSQDDSLTYLNQFMNWTEENDMSCNTSKCKELVLNKSGRAEQYIYHLAL